MLPELASIGYWDAPANQSWSLDWHRNEGLELTFLARGHLEFAVQDEAYHLKNGQLILTRPWQKHRVGNPYIHASRLHWVILDLGGVRRPDEDWKWPKWLVFSTRDRERLTELLRHCEDPVWNASPAIAIGFENLARQLEAGAPAAAETHLRILLNSVF